MSLFSVTLRVTETLFLLFLLPPAVVSDLTLRVSQDSTYLQTLGGLGSPSAPLPVLLFPLCCRVCGLTLEEADLEEDKAEAEGEGDAGQVNSPFLDFSSFCSFLLRLSKLFVHDLLCGVCFYSNKKLHKHPSCHAPNLSLVYGRWTQIKQQRFVFNQTVSMVTVDMKIFSFS